MYEIEIMLQNGATVDGYISDQALNAILPLIKKKRFWRNKVLYFELFDLREDGSWEYSCTVTLRNKEIIIFTHKFVSNKNV